jgi:hypothetical protein
MRNLKEFAAFMELDHADLRCRFQLLRRRCFRQARDITTIKKSYPHWRCEVNSGNTFDMSIVCTALLPFSVCKTFLADILDTKSGEKAAAENIFAVRVTSGVRYWSHGPARRIQCARSCSSVYTSIAPDRTRPSRTRRAGWVAGPPYHPSELSRPVARLFKAWKKKKILLIFVELTCMSPFGAVSITVSRLSAGGGAGGVYISLTSAGFAVTVSSPELDIRARQQEEEKNKKKSACEKAYR